jgi:hypothetical protein
MRETWNDNRFNALLRGAIFRIQGNHFEARVFIMRRDFKGTIQPFELWWRITTLLIEKTN